jgi:hypothetical protein
MQQLLNFSKFLAVGVVLLIAFSGCNKDEEQPTAPDGGIASTAFPNNTASLSPGGGPVQGKLTGGTAPYTIQTQPDAAVATAALSGASSDTLTISPVAVGNTSVVIEDASTGMGDNPTGQTVTILITVSEGGGGGGAFAGSGTFSVNTSAGNFSASGAYDSNATSGQGVGALRYTVTGESPSDADILEIIAYDARSVADVDLVFIAFTYQNGTLMPMEYPYASTTAWSTFGIGFGVNLNDPSDIYVAISGSASITSLTASSVAGTCSGTATNSMLQSLTFSAGSFNVNEYGTGNAPDGPLEEKILAAVRKAKANAR